MPADNGEGVFFVADVFRHLRVRPDKSLMVSAGARVREVFLAKHGALPPKKLGPKSDGSGGTHCFAYYPNIMWGDAVSIVTDLKGKPDPQLVFDF
jgi:hypothetical protein